jgi:hypothetical protein
MRGLTHQRRLAAALVPALLAVAPPIARAHWVAPEDIVAGLNQNEGLRLHAGLVEAKVDRKLPRLLIIRVKRETWQKVPPEKRLALAQAWRNDWYHAVEAGIVAVLDADTDRALVNYDGLGNARLAGDP